LFLFFLWVVSTCALTCLVLLMDGWVSILDFNLQGFSSFSMHNELVSAHGSGEGFLGPRLRFWIVTSALDLPFTSDVGPLFMFLPFSSGLVLFL
jgi:hypothetical protein